MAVSGSVDYSVAASDIITEALELVGALGEGESPTTAQNTSSLRTLNMMTKAWQAEPGGTNLFALQRTYLFLQPNVNEYTLSASGDNFTSSFVQSTLAADGAVGASSITVASDTGMLASDYIGIELDDGTLQWTTINGTPASDVVTLTAVLTGAASSGNTVYTYTTKANRPMGILHAAVIDTGNNEVPIRVEELTTYADLPLKTSDGQINTIFFLPQVGTSTLYVWPQTDSVDDYLKLWAKRTLYDFDATSDDADYPQEWYMALALNLAVLIAPKSGVPMDQFNKLKSLASEYKDMAESGDTEGGFTLEPEMR